MISVYFAKNEEELKYYPETFDYTSFEYSNFLYSDTDSEHRVAVVYDEEHVEILSNLIKSDTEGTKRTEILKEFSERIIEILEGINLPRQNREQIHVFIHFGNQNGSIVKKYNLWLSKNSEREFRFFAISKGNFFPEELFQDGKIIPPTGEDYAKMLSTLQENKDIVEKSQDVDRLRYILILCQLMVKCRQEDKLRGETAREWWKFKRSEFCASTGIDLGNWRKNFTEKEQRIISRNKELEKLCSIIYGSGEFDVTGCDFKKIAEICLFN